MKHHCQRVENQNKEICMLIKVNYDSNLHCFNDTVQTNVAVDSEPPFERNMISFSKVNGIIKYISVLDSIIRPFSVSTTFSKW